MHEEEVVNTKDSHKLHMAFLDLCLPDEASKNSTRCPDSQEQNFRAQAGRRGNMERGGSLRGPGSHLSLVEVECGGKRIYWTTHVCLSSMAACPGRSF